MKRTSARSHAVIVFIACAMLAIPTAVRSEAMPPHAPERNKDVVRRLYDDVINRGRHELLPELVAEEFVGDQGGRGPAGYAANVAALKAGFPDIRFTIHDLVAEGDRVVVRWTWEGTHTGVFRTWGPSGRRVRNSRIAIYRLDAGKAVRTWLETDRLGVLQAIGVIPAGLVPVAPAPSH